MQETERRVQEARGHIPLRPFTAETAPEAIRELESFGVPFDIKVLYGRKTHLRIVLTVGEKDETPVRDILGSLAPSADAEA